MNLTIKVIRKAKSIIDNQMIYVYLQVKKSLQLKITN